MPHNLTGALLRSPPSLNITAGLLEGSLRSCNAQFEPAYVLDRLGVSLLTPNPGLLCASLTLLTRSLSRRRHWMEDLCP
jgi:hypothetical protein